MLAPQTAHAASPFSATAIKARIGSVVARFKRPQRATPQNGLGEAQAEARDAAVARSAAPAPGTWEHRDSIVQGVRAETDPGRRAVLALEAIATMDTPRNSFARELARTMTTAAAHGRVLDAYIKRFEGQLSDRSKDVVAYLRLRPLNADGRPPAPTRAAYRGSLIEALSDYSDIHPDGKVRSVVRQDAKTIRVLFTRGRDYGSYNLTWREDLGAGRWGVSRGMLHRADGEEWDHEEL